MTRYLLALPLVFSSCVSFAKLQEFEATYNLFRSGEQLGVGKRTLSQTEKGLWQLSYSTDIKWMIFSDHRFESSTFKIAENQVQPVKYVFERTGTGRDKEYLLNFAYDKQQVLSGKRNKPAEAQWKEHLLDQLSYQLQLRLDAAADKTSYSYPVVTKKGKNKTYEFTLEGTEVLTLDQNKVNTLKLKRSSGSRITYAWIAPDMNNLLVRLWQSKEGVEQYDVKLAEVKFN